LTPKSQRDRSNERETKSKSLFEYVCERKKERYKQSKKIEQEEKLFFIKKERNRNEKMKL